MFGISPEFIARIPLNHIVFWHRRAYEFARERQQSQESWLQNEVGRAVKLLPAR